MLLTAFKQAALMLVAAALLMQSAYARIGTFWPDILEAAYQGDLDRVVNLLDRGADVNVSADDGTTPLLVAASRGHLAIVKTLLARGADLNAQNKAGWTALMLATQKRHLRIVQLLLERGADWRVKNKQGSTALTMAKSTELANLFDAKVGKNDHSTPTPKDIPKPPPQEEKKPAKVQPAKSHDAIKSLLALAAGQLEKSYLTTPKNDNAYETYRRVLERDPGNPVAQEGLRRIADRYERMARQRKARGEIPQGLANVKEGLRVLPDHAGLRDLQEELRATFEKNARASDRQAREAAIREERRRTIDQLLIQAEQQLSARNLTTPAGNNARETYNKILNLDPGNQAAEDGLTGLSTNSCEYLSTNIC